jgi:hypothetical protein
MLWPTFANRCKSQQNNAKYHGNCSREPVITGSKTGALDRFESVPIGMASARLQPHSGSTHLIENQDASETIRDHIALFNECVRLHLNNELRQ